MPLFYLSRCFRFQLRKKKGKQKKPEYYAAFSLSRCFRFYPGKRKVSKRNLNIALLFRSLAASAFPRKKKGKQKKPKYYAAFLLSRCFRFFPGKRKVSKRNLNIAPLLSLSAISAFCPGKRKVAPKTRILCCFLPLSGSALYPPLPCNQYARSAHDLAGSRTKKQNARLIQADRPVHCDKYSTFSDVCQRFFIGFSQKMPEKPPIRAKNFFLQAFFSRTYRCCAPSCAREASRRVSPRPRCGGTRPRLRGRSRPRRSTPYRSRPPRTRGRNS